jgi:hypothetical protein
MSTLSQFAPFAGGGLKSFQTGYVAPASNSIGAGSGEDAYFFDVTISAVNTAKAIPCCYGSYQGFASNYSIQSEGSEGSTVGKVLPRLTSGTNLRLSTDINVFNVNVKRMAGRWQVAEAN